MAVWGWRRMVVIGSAAVGGALGFGGGSILFAANSDDCAFGPRQVTLMPPGMHCGGPKDGWYNVPWDSRKTMPMAPLPYELAGTAAGAALIGLPSARLVRQRRSGEAPSP